MLNVFLIEIKLESYKNKNIRLIIGDIIKMKIKKYMINVEYQDTFEI